MGLGPLAADRRRRLTYAPSLPPLSTHSCRANRRTLTVEKAPVGAGGEEPVGARLNHTDLMEAQGVVSASHSASAACLTS
jgi:hypothetical protein